MVTLSPTELAQDLFAPLPTGYERWARILSMGQDDRWRRRMVDELGVAPSWAVLDIAAGTGSITRLLQERDAGVVSLDLSQPMLRQAVARGARGVVATAEALPFPDSCFDAVTFGYLLRYVDDVTGCMTEIRRVMRPGGRVGMVEFGRPSGVWRPAWWAYTRIALPVGGLFGGKGWYRVGRFLGPNIDSFADRYPPPALARLWESVGFGDVRYERMSLGGGLVMSGTKDG
jgi:demethylmenaquinone methyltransferase/2-methoxy-6-polyprenyl-1,4-benzoquinol methylase